MRFHFKKLFLLIFVLVGVFLGLSVVDANSDSENVTISATYAGGEQESPPIIEEPIEEEVVDITAPVVSVTNISTSDLTATVAWTADDDFGVVGCTFQYGPTSALGSSASPAGGGGSFSVSLSGLISGNTYFYQVSCFDLAGNTGVSLGSFTTQESTPPVISAVSTVVDLTTAIVTWTAIDNIAVDYCTFGYDTDSINPPFQNSSYVNFSDSSYTTNLSSLKPNTEYYYQIFCVDTAENSSVSTGSFQTLKDSTPPPDVFGLLGETGDSVSTISWSYTSSISDFAYFLIERNGVQLAQITDVNQNQVVDSGLINLTPYDYVVYTVDTSGNKSSGVSINLTPHLNSETNYCSDGLDNDIDGLSDCSDSECSADPFCVSNIEICNNNIDDDNDGLIDCGDFECIGTNFCPILPEICNDGLDNDADGFLDCFDSDCSAEPACRVLGPACDDGVDNDKDGLYDMQDPGCENPNDNDEYNTSLPTIPAEDRIALSNLFFWLSERTIETGLDKNILSVLVGDQVTIGISETALNLKVPKSITLKLLGGSYKFNLNRTDGWYYADFIAPTVGLYDAYIELDYEDNLFDSINFKVNSLPYGFVRDGLNSEILSGVQVILYDQKTGGAVWSYGQYRQENPQITGANGAYAFVVPKGSFKLTAEKDGYRKKETLSFVVNNRIVNKDITLIKKPKPLIDSIDPEAPILENVQNVVANLSEKAVEQGRILSDAFDEGKAKVDEIANNPAVEQVTKTVVAPSVVGVSAMAIAPSLWTTVIPLLRFLFFQPVLLFWRKERKKWGIVYDSLTKLPVDLATVRLYSAKTHKVTQSRVTDRQGRFLFDVDPGEYIIKVTKNGFVFPSSNLEKAKDDGDFLDLYHGEIIKVEAENTVITPNIPLDASRAEKVPWKVVLKSRAKVAQQVVSLVGLITTIIAFYITPEWYIGVFLVLHILLYFGFKNFVKPKKLTGWGIVRYKKTKKPIGKVITRLFSKEFNKLIETKITDSKGRYAFLVGPSDYYLTFEKTGFARAETEPIVSSEVEKEGFIGKNVELQKAGEDAYKNELNDKETEDKSGKNDKWLDKMQKKGMTLHNKTFKKIKKAKKRLK